MKIRSIVALLSVAFAGFALSAHAQNVYKADDRMDGYSVESPNTTTHTFSANGYVFWVSPYSPAQQKQAAQQNVIAQINQTADWNSTTKNNAIYVVNHVVWDDTTRTVAVGGQSFRYTASQEICAIGDCNPQYRIIITSLQLTGPL
jgi:hypothetical protein